MNKYTCNYKLTILFSLMSIGWVIALFVESSQQPAEFIGAVEGLDKAAHFVAFVVLALLVCAAWFFVTGKQNLAVYLVPLLIVILMGVVEEFYQSSVRGTPSQLAGLSGGYWGGAVFAIIVAKRVSLIIRSRHRIRED